jgi:hypothetical protein
MVCKDQRFYLNIYSENLFFTDCIADSSDNMQVNGAFCLLSFRREQSKSQFSEYESGDVERSHVQTRELQPVDLGISKLCYRSAVSSRLRSAL